MTFKNETPERLEVCIPVRVFASVRIFLEPGEELTAQAINEAVDEAAAGAINNAPIDLGDHRDILYEVVGVERDGDAALYNEYLHGETSMPDGVEYAE